MLLTAALRRQQRHKGSAAESSSAYSTPISPHPDALSSVTKTPPLFDYNVQCADLINYICTIPGIAIHIYIIHIIQQQSH
jgi:hypothetical protein